MTGAPVLSTTCVSLTFKIPVAIAREKGGRAFTTSWADILAFVDGEDFTGTYCEWLYL